MTRTVIYEHATLSIQRGREDAFEQAFLAEALPLFARVDGCHGAELRRCIEEPSEYNLIVGWDSVEAHMVGFRSSPLFAQWRAIVGDFFAQPPAVSHYETVS